MAYSGLIDKMALGFGQKKSAGVVVSPRIHKMIAEGNAARGRDWHAAATCYAAVVAEAPELKHIWVQLGHARKESGDIEGAEDAYVQAAALDGADAEPVLHLGHLYKTAGRGQQAVAQYVRAFAIDPGSADALGEIQTLLERSAPGVSREMLLKVLRSATPQESGTKTTGMADDAIEASALDTAVLRARRAGLPDEQIAALEAAREALMRQPVFDLEPFAGHAMVFDASDLISYFKNARLPTGIQRVQIATISNALASRAKGSVRICCFSDADDHWTEVPAASFSHLCTLAVASGDRNDPEWLQTLTKLHLTLRVAEPFEFPGGAFLINLGTSWWLQNYFLFVREAKRRHGIRYVPFVHDFIPIMTPEHCVRELTQDFISWALGAYQHADFFLVNSYATKRDLVEVGAILGHQVDTSLVAVIPLDADFRRPARADGFSLANRLREWKLKSRDFVLIVSTIESRKNHIGALDAWTDLIRRHGARNVPKLVCVGNRGWLNDAVYSRIDLNPALRERVVMLQGLSDDELALLYQECRFTLYPSNYEGWGLPVTESLCYGKVPLISDSSSLPEAGGVFAEYFSAGSTAELTAAAERLIFDASYLRGKEATIAAEFRPRRWQDIAGQIADELEGFVARVDAERPACAQPVEQGESIAFGAYYPIERNFHLRIWPGLSSAEMFRTGTGWWWPDDWGCWTKPAGGELTMRVPRTGKALRCYVNIVAPPGEACGYTVSLVGSDVAESATLAADAERWVMLQIPASDRSVLTLTIEGTATFSLADQTGGLDSRAISIGVAGFLICETDDLATRADFAEAVALHRLDLLAFNRETSRDGRSA